MDRGITECYLTVDLWDVGQGNTSVLSVADGSLIIIDVGPRTGPLPDWLLRKPHRIRVIAITHNDSDHIGALTGIASDPQQQIETVYLLRDPKSDRNPRKFILQYRELMERKRRGATRVLTLCQGQRLWHDDTAELAVDVVYPDYFDNLEAKTSNVTSGVIVLRHKSIPIVVWGGDAPLGAVARGASHNCHPLVLDGPHHGAPQGGYVKEMGPALSQIAAGRLHVSVGSSNAYEHPQARYLKEALRQRMSVTCTQITQKCGWRPGRPALIQISGKLGLPSPYTGCPCRGTTRLSLDADGWHFDKWDQVHHEAIAHGVSHPICMTGSSAGCPAR